MDYKKIRVEGMNCNHCKMTVENNLRKMPGVNNVRVDLSEGKVLIEGENIDLTMAEKTIDDLGYKYRGLISD